jgi:N-acyl-D-aspartate/D-glutamate deacylase
MPEGVNQRHLRYSSEIPTFYQNYLAMRNTAGVTGGKSIAIISGRDAVNPLVAFYDIHARKGEVVLFYLVADTTRDYPSVYNMMNE